MRRRDRGGLPGCDGLHFDRVAGSNLRAVTMVALLIGGVAGALLVVAVVVAIAYAAREERREK